MKKYLKAILIKRLKEQIASIEIENDEVVTTLNLGEFKSLYLELN